MADTDDSLAARDDSHNASDGTYNNNDYGLGTGSNESGNGTGVSIHWDGDSNVGAGHGTFGDSSPVPVPAVPRNGATGPGAVAVSTPSLDLFAANIERLIQPVKDVATALEDVSVAPGAFYHANMMRNKVNGPNGDTGLKKAFTDSLASLVTGLTDLRDGVKALSAKYRTVEEANGMTARDFHDALSDAVGDFNAVATVAGGAGTDKPGPGAGNSPAPS
ncbi:hypothetical protein F7Q99_29320 [Streptomyces kaniharaensis]|uniref:Uncharacterized protein n=1 Tax=Streptomyces kaniharaensis TaxID=212423 RepID=A0A6N7L0Y3_9ACTN|nr:hypothetical protein [Streptomyces kaniharaensis]MQS16218.1 hypothetical protein [Streptomyces kaniharaensis]